MGWEKTSAAILLIAIALGADFLINRRSCRKDSKVIVFCVLPSGVGGASVRWIPLFVMFHRRRMMSFVLNGPEMRRDLGGGLEGLVDTTR